MTAPRNPFAYPKPITLDSLSDLFSHHRGLAAGWSMEDGGGAGDDDKGDGDKGKQDPPAYTPPQTQADLDRIVGERLARERDKFKDYSDLKRKAEAHDKALADAQTEQEKAVIAARKEGEDAATTAANSRLIAAEARALAAQAGFRSLADVNLLDLSAVTVNDDGAVDTDAIKARLKELSDADPWRLGDGKRPAPKPDPGQGGAGSAKPGDDGRLAAQRFFPSRPKAAAGN